MICGRRDSKGITCNGGTVTLGIGNHGAGKWDCCRSSRPSRIADSEGVRRLVATVADGRAFCISTQLHWICLLVELPALVLAVAVSLHLCPSSSLFC